MKRKVRSERNYEIICTKIGRWQPTTIAETAIITGTTITAAITSTIITAFIYYTLVEGISIRARRQ